MEVDKAMDEYGDWHRQFVQALISRPVLTADQLKKLFRDTCGDAANASNNNDSLKTFLRTIKAELRPFGLDLEKGRSERDGSLVYALINTSEGEETTACAGYSEQQLRFLQAIIQDVVTSAHGHISSAAALNLVDGLQPRMSRADAQTALSQLVDDCWLEEDSTDHRIALHTRCIIEMRPYLKRHFAEYVPSCGLCNALAVRGVTCGGCDAKYHTHCLQKMRRNVSVVKCRSCQAQIPTEEAASGRMRR